MNLEEIEARLAAATPGPWAFASAPAEGSSETPAEYVANALTGAGPLFVVWVPATEGAAGGYVLTAVTGDGPHASFDAEFIAHAPTDIRALLAEVKRLQAQIDAVKELHKPVAANVTAFDGTVIERITCECCLGGSTDHIYRPDQVSAFPCGTRRALDGDES